MKRKLEAEIEIHKLDIEIGKANEAQDASKSPHIHMPPLNTYSDAISIAHSEQFRPYRPQEAIIKPPHIHMPPNINTDVISIAHSEQFRPYRPQEAIIKPPHIHMPPNIKTYRDAISIAHSEQFRPYRPQEAIIKPIMTGTGISKSKKSLALKEPMVQSRPPPFKKGKLSQNPLATPERTQQVLKFTAAEQTHLWPNTVQAPRFNSRDQRFKGEGEGEGKGKSTLAILANQIGIENPIQLNPEEPNPSSKATKGIRSKPRFFLTENNISSWRKNKQFQITEEQSDILHLVWNHIRAGTMDPHPVRQMEKMFNNLNKKIVFQKITEKQKEDLSSKPSTVLPEINLEEYDETATLKPNTIEFTMFPSYFQGFYKWNLFYQYINNCDWDGLVENFYGKDLVPICKNKVLFIKEKNKSNKITVNGNLNSDVFKDLFDYGFIEYFEVNEFTTAMLKQAPKPIHDYSQWLWNNRKERSQSGPIWLKVISAPPFHNNQEWLNVQMIKERPPQLFPSVHLVLEEQEPFNIDKHSIACFKAPVEYRLTDQKTERGEQLLSIMATLEGDLDHYTWNDYDRILCKALLCNDRDQLSLKIANNALFPEALF